MHIQITGVISTHGEEVRVEVEHDGFDSALTPAMVEDLVASLADDVARKLIAARVA